MEIVKAFNENHLHTDIVIKGTYTNPLFRASDIGEILEMGNIRTSIQNFDDTERHVHSMDTSTGPKQVTFLTEKGLYKILFKSRKPIAEKFQNWGQGYYGLSLKSDYKDYKKPSTTSKKVYKLDTKTKEIINTWDTIAKAAEAEQFSSAKMSRIIKNQTLINFNYLYTLQV